MPTHKVSGQGVIPEKAIEKKRLSELFGALPATRPFPGEDEIREEVGKALGEDMERRIPKTTLANRRTFAKSEQ